MGQIWSQLAVVEPMLARFGPHLAEFAQIWCNTGRPSIVISTFDDGRIAPIVSAPIVSIHGQIDDGCSRVPIDKFAKRQQ